MFISPENNLQKKKKFPQSNVLKREVDSQFNYTLVISQRC